MKKYALGMMAMGLMAGSASAATITWTSAPFVNEGVNEGTMGTGQFDTSGTLLYAENTGGGATTYDGIAYSAGAISFPGGNANVFHDVNAVSGTGTFGNSGADTVTLGTGGVGPALNIGTEYRVEVLIMDGRAGAANRNVQVDGVDRGSHANGISGITWGDGLLVTGTFTADAATQTFTVEVLDGTTSAGGQINALLLTEVPEPGSLALLGLGSLLIARRRRD
ncbi:MAG: PEP-CTERM sorting domain-containing protein [Phycisphaeraceae bacterium]